jgi:uncharacterized protein (TIGR03086 family)
MTLTAPIESVVVLSRAIDQTGDVMSLVHEDQLSLPTPCGDWDVARLLSHVVAMPRNFVEMADGIEVDWTSPPEPVTVGWTADFRSLADDLIHFWHQVGEDADPQQVDWQTAELAVHTWDLARAIGHSPHLDPEVAERALAFMTSALTPDVRGQSFGPEVPIADDAPVYDRLAAFAGRHP